jgi:tetratricopeptide (TPR) repeat protein
VAATLIVLLGGAIVSTILWITAARQRAVAMDRQRESEAVVKFLTDDVLASAKPEVALGREISVRQALDRAAANISARFADRPQVQAIIQDTLGTCYHALGRTDLGLTHAQAALALRRQLLGSEHLATLDSINNVGAMLSDLGRYGEAEPLYREALDARRRVLGPDDPLTLISMSNLAHLFQQQGKLEACELLSREALSRKRAVLGNDAHETLVAINNLASVLHDMGKLPEAEALYREALERSGRVLGPDHPHTLGSMSNLALLLKQEGNPQAESLLRDAIDARRRVLGDDHPDTLLSINNLGSMLFEEKRFAAAEALFGELPDKYVRAFGPSHPQTLTAMNNLAFVLETQGKHAQAEPWRAKLAAEASSSQASPGQRALYVARYGVCLARLGKFDQAEQPLRDGQRAMLEAGQGKHRDMREVLSSLAQTCDHTNHGEEAASWRAQLSAWEASTRPSTRTTTMTTTTTPASEPRNQ